MKVLYLITKSNWGGAQRYVYDLATNLDRDRFTPLVALGGEGQLAHLLKHAEIPTIPLNALKRDINLRAELAVARELWRIIRQERPDILHLNSSKAGALGALVGRLAGVPRVIFTAHGWAFNEDRPWYQRLLLKSIHWLTVMLAHRTIAVSSATAAQMNWPGAAKRMHIRNPGREIGVRFSKADARHALIEFAPALKPYEHDPWIGMVAELHPIKQHQVLLEALPQVFEMHKNARVVLIGDGELFATLRSEIKARGLDQQVFLLGAVPEAARFLRAFTVTTLPSRSESYGYVLHESGLLGVPVVASDVGGIRDIITHEKTGLLVTPNEPAALSTALSRLLSDAPLRKRLATELHAAMSERTVPAMARATEALYTL